MNWLAHLFLSEPKVEDRLGNILADIVKGKDRKKLSPRFNKGIECQLLVDSFTDTHLIVKHSKKIISPEYKRYSGLLVDIFYDHLLARNWSNYSQFSLSQFNQEIYESFLKNLDGVPEKARKIITQTIDEEWLGSYYHISGIEKALIRIKKRLSPKHNDLFVIEDFIEQIELQYSQFERDFKIFFPEIIDYLISVRPKTI